MDGHTRGRGPGRAIGSGRQRGRGGRSCRGCGGGRHGAGRAEAEAAVVVDNDADETDAKTSAGREGGTLSWPGGKELITYRRMHECPRDSRAAERESS